MTSYLFRTDDGPGIGAGHLMRCLALAEEIANTGGTIYVAAARPSSLHERWKAIGAQVEIGNHEIGNARDLGFTLSIAKSAETDWTIVDGYGFTTDWLDALGRRQQILCLDDIAERNPAVDLVLNHNPGAEQRYTSKYLRSAKRLLGLDWFLLRREFVPAIVPAKKNRLLLCLGGEDPENRALELMRALLADGRDFFAEVVSTAPESGKKEVAALAASDPQRFKMHAGPQNLAPLMRQAGVMICGGGVTAIEALSMGLSVVIIVLADNQSQGAAFLQQSGLACVVPRTEAWASAATQAAFAFQAHEMRVQRVRSKSKIDGQGPKRVFKQMELQ